MNYTQPSIRIGIIGTGRVGSVLGSKWAASGHQVRFGVRNIHSPRVQQILHANIAGIEVDSIDSAIEFGEFIILAIPAEATVQFIDEYQRDLRGKNLVDPSLTYSAQIHSEHSTIQGFSLFGFENLDHPLFGDTPADLFYCSSNHESAYSRFDLLIGELGFRPVRVGGLQMTDALQSLATITSGVTQQRRFGHRFALKLLT